MNVIENRHSCITKYECYWKQPFLYYRPILKWPFLYFPYCKWSVVYYQYGQWIFVYYLFERKKTDSISILEVSSNKIYALLYSCFQRTPLRFGTTLQPLLGCCRRMETIYYYMYCAVVLAYSYSVKCSTCTL